MQYLTATLLLNEAFEKQVEEAFDAYFNKTGDFRSLAAKLDRPSLLALLELGGRCQECDWQLPVREQGMQTVLPYLNTVRVMADMLMAQAISQAQEGDVEAAVRTIRVGVELGRKTAHGPLLLCGLVGAGMVSLMDEALTEVMNRPESPNLYWALASMPRPLMKFSDSIEGEGSMLAGSIPELAAQKLDGLSGNDWHRIFKQAAQIVTSNGPRPWNRERGVADAVVNDLPKARDFYAQAYGLTAEQVSGLDPFKVVCTFWYQEYLNLVDEEQAAGSLAYPALIARLGEARERSVQLKKDQPANVFLEFYGSFDRAAVTFARGDRMRAALADVEAIRSYAAGHDGELPARLQDIKDTPVLDNPLTGKAFDYSVDGENALLWDSGPQWPLSYTVRIRK